MVNRMTEMVVAKKKMAENVEISIWLIDDEQQMAELNEKHRGVDSSTDVLSFPQYERKELEELFANSYEENFESETNIPLGDIIISLNKVKEQAREYGHSEEREFGFLYLHGLLHLLGYDHGDESNEKEMFNIKEDILAELGLQR